MITDSLELGSRDWLPGAALLLAVGIIALVWSLWRSPVRGFTVWLSAFCKLVAIASVALYLVEPQLRSSRPKPGANALAVVVDNSRSMSIRAPGQTISLEDKLKDVLRMEADWHARASQDFSVRLYGFDSRLRSLDSFEQLKFDGNSSSLGDALGTVRERYANRPAAGILVFTDGMSTDTLPSLQNTENPVPIYPVVDLGRDQLRDISIGDPAITQSAFEIAPVQIEATVRCVGFKDQVVTVRLFDEKNLSVSEQSIKVDADSFEKRLRFQYRPKEPGIQFARLRAMLQSEDDAAELVVPSRQEVTTTNNTRLLSIDRGGGPYRILYLAGRANWDFKFFRRAVEEDQELRMSGLVRIAKKEAKFNFRDRSVTDSNPLFAGFEDDQDAAEKYDEPILLRIGVREEDELKAGFPKTEAELFQYHAIVLDDIEARFFTQEQMLLIRQFVASRGGGFLMMGGSDSFDRGGYRDTPIGDLLPIYLTKPSLAESTSTTGVNPLATSPLGSEDSDSPSVAYRLTREGGLEPWMRLRGSELDEAKRLSDMPRFFAWNKIKDVKPGASILATMSGDDSANHPAMIVQNFGSGRVGALTIADMWRWTMRRAQEDSNDLAQCWRQMARWLTADVPKRLQAEIIPPQKVNDPHAIKITVRDESYLPLDNASFEVAVLPPDGKLVPVDVTPDRQQSGLYLANFWSQVDGPYVVSVKAKSADGEEIGEVESGWSAEPSAIEFRNLAPNLEELAALAKQSGGEVIDIDQLDSFVRTLPTRQVPITETRIEPLWHSSSWLTLTLLCLCAEWGLRRLRGLA